MSVIEFFGMPNYNSELLEFLESSKKRNNLIEILLNRKIQKHLFEEDKLKNILDDLTMQIKDNKSLYQRWVQKSQNQNKSRLLNVPNKNLRLFIENYLMDLIKSKEVHKNCHGAEKGWSVKKSLERHLPCSTAFSFDLESAFENTSFIYVKNLFYELMDNQLPQSGKEEVANFLSILSTVNYHEKRGLPQGSPSGMAIFNRILCILDEKISNGTEKRNMKYSRWVDDITITSENNQKIEYFLGAVELTATYFPIAKEKIFFQEKDIIYLLGHKLIDNKVLKNSKEERLKNKISPLNYDKWLSKDESKNYESW